MGKYKIYYGKKPNGEWKIGCTLNYPHRCQRQKLRDYYIIEEHDDEFIASNRERELQNEYNLREDEKPYHKSIQRTKGMSGKNHSDETKLKISKANSGRTLSETHKDKLKEAWKNRDNSGENNPIAVLTEDKVRYIRKWCKQGRGNGVSHGRMARAFGISQAHVTKIVNRETWTHI